MSTAEAVPDIRSTATPTPWKVPLPAPPEAVERLVRELKLPPLLASVMWSRGFRADVTTHLDPPLVPTPIPTLEEAAGKLEQALRQQRRILIHGDYDADGLCGTALLSVGLRALGARVETFIPDRLKDGYGIARQRLEEHAKRCDLFITVDCGISNLEELSALNSLGVETIVTDHHHPGDSLPSGLVVHPRLSPSADSGLPELTGAGVAYHLLWALHRRLGLEDPIEYSDLAAIGTIADVAPLLGDNRALVRAGLAQMSASRWPGLRAALAQARLRRAPTARDVAFVIAPRLNAAGRLGEADKGLELLTTSSERRASELAAYLEARNLDRRKLQDEMFEQALAQTDHEAPALVLEDDDWHPGVMGIVAAKLLERFYKPVFIIAQGKGSVRSPPGISAVNALRAAAPHLVRYGGHAQAAGFGIDPAEIDGFRRAIYRFVSQHPAPRPSLSADALITAGEVDHELFKALDLLEPYGEGHASPVLALCDRLDSARAVGRDRATLQLRVGGLRGVAWQKGELATGLVSGSFVKAAISIRQSEWQGQRELEFVASEIEPLERFSVAAEEGLSTLPPTAVFRRGAAPSGKPWSSEQGGEWPAVCWLRRLPLGSDPLTTTATLRRIAGSADAVHFDLDEAAVEEAFARADLLPTVAEVRLAFVYLQRGSTPTFPQPKLSLVRRVLSELELVDGLGRVRRGQKRDPYSSATLMTSLIERYRLTSLLKAYRSLDDEGFNRSAVVLLLESGSTPSRTAAMT